MFIREGTKVDGYILVRDSLKFKLWKNPPPGKTYRIEDKSGKVLPGYDKMVGEEADVIKEFERVEKELGGIISSWDELPKEGVISVYGFRGMGKSATVWDLAEKLHKEGREVVALLPDKKLAKTLLPDWVEVITDPNEILVCKGKVVVADEMALQANARESMSEANRHWTKLMAIVRQLHILLLIACQHTRQLDVQLAMDVDWIVFKKPSIKHIQMARPELADDVKSAFEAFMRLRWSLKDGDDPNIVKQWSYVADIHEGRAGFLKNGLPSFWSDDLSTYFATAYAQEIAEKGDSGKKIPHRRNIEELEAGLEE
jgi:hypothetical protein